MGHTKLHRVLKNYATTENYDEFIETTNCCHDSYSVRDADSSEKKTDQPHTQNSRHQEKWQEQSLCIGPSMTNGAGYGVFATRKFNKGDVVEVAPMFLRFCEEERPRVLKETILNDYHYEYWSWTGVGTTHVLGSMLSFGYTMYYNHGPNPNIENRKWGIEPDVDNVNNGVAVGYFALRDIEIGDELINDYGGEDWFEERGMKLFQPPHPNNNMTATMRLSQQKLQDYTAMYRSRLYSGYGLPTYQTVLDWWYRDGDVDISPYNLESLFSFLPSQKVGYGNVIAKERADPGDLLEFAPALLLKKSYVIGTVLESLAVDDWIDLCSRNNNIDDVEVESTTIVNIQYQPDPNDDEDNEEEENDDEASNDIKPSSWLAVPVADTVLLPLAGTVGLLHRNKVKSNAELHVVTDRFNKNGFCFHVVAKKQVEVGDRIVVDLMSSLNDASKIQEELACTGQPVAF